MNYLGHLLMAGDNPEAYRIGAIAPDIANMHGTRVLPQRRHLFGDPLYNQFYSGYNFHLSTDALFDCIVSRLGVKERFKKDIAPRLAVVEPRATLLVKDVAPDLLIDGEIQKIYPGISNSYVKLLRNFGAIGTSEVFVDGERVSLGLRTRYDKSPPDYSNPEVVVSILLRSINRGKKTPRIPETAATFGAMVRAVTEYQAILQPYAPELLSATASALGVALPEPANC